MGRSSDPRPPFPLYTRFPSAAERIAYKAYNFFDNSLYPIRPLIFGASVAGLAALFSKHDFQFLHPSMGYGVTEGYARLAVASLLSAYIPVLLTRQLLKRCYFGYKGWLFENPKRPSLRTKAWGALRQLLSLVPPIFHSCESLLPSPSVPALEKSVAKYMASVQQLHSKEELAKIEEMAKQFLRSEGRKLQWYAKVYSLFVDNYVTGFWEKYAYHYGRDGLLINSNVCMIDLFTQIPATQAVRAARIVFIEARSMLAIDRQEFGTLSGGLVCTEHYKKMYAVSRVPGDECDHLVNYGISRHVAVLFRGGIYRVEACADDGRLYTVEELTDVFNELVARPPVEGAESKLPALTTDKRSSWASNRRRFFEGHPSNKKALETIESSILFLTLTDNEDWDYVPSSPEVVSTFARQMLSGDGANRWADKALNYVVAKNGRCGAVTEHSAGDGSEFDHIYENYVVLEHMIEYPSMEEQRKREEELDVVELVKRGVKLAERIEVDVDEEMASEIERCYADFAPQRDDLDMASLIFRDWGKGRIKKCGVSPDAFVQMAIQMANYRDQGRFVPTYEAASARFYRNSRTETLRSVTDESCDFVRAMEDPSIDRATRASLLKKAAELHVEHNKECMTNQGVDRHLFVLCILAHATGVSSPFLQHYIKQQWLLSTSQLPNITNTMKEDENPDKSWIGACFGAVAKTGYGVCYRFAGNHSINVHISSYHSSANTDSKRLRQRLVTAFNELSALFD